jgi:formylglycine-generating enzyme required for sulfatase activity
MILIDAQTFEMGCTAGMSSCDSDESPAHSVTLTNDFYIGETEVTQGEYEAMMGSSPSSFSGCGSDCPVEHVSWHGSAAFANAVSDSEGLEQCYTCTGSGTSASCSIAVEPYSCRGYRLPTEPEWEAAARCGEDTLYAGSTVIDDVAWYDGNSDSTPHAVATKASNTCGLYDMSGNVWEWTQDWYSDSYYSTSPSTDPAGPASGGSRVLRGGSWRNAAATVRVADRTGYDPPTLDSNVGFRLIKTHFTCADGSVAPADDKDCDGVVTTDDCDDTDPDSTTIGTDGDCDGREDDVADHGGTMILIEAQTFEMGCTAGMSSCDTDEYPAHSVTLTNDFYIGETEVTQGEFEAVMGWNPAYFIACGLDCPMENVSWHEAAEFANAVSASEGLEQCYTCTGTGTTARCESADELYSCEGYRLPTEAEREAAARCGEDTLYAGSTVIGDVSWYTEDSGGTPHAVATKASNACGLYDMSGNLHEWIQDLYSSTYYSGSPSTDPAGLEASDPTSDGQRVFRGGSWTHRAADSRVAFRDRDDPSFRGGYIGFRLARTGF